MNFDTKEEHLEAFKKGLACGKLVVKLADSNEEREQVYKLRFEVFNEELGEGIPENAATGLDRDQFDDFCDHLMVISDGQTIGTYRLLPGIQKPADGFYTETEFDLNNIKYNPADVVELGRGCIKPEFRKQNTLMSLFWGLDQYIKARGARYLMGCASLPPMSANQAEAVYASLVEQQVVNLALGFKPRPENAFVGDASKGEAQLPPLVKFYLQFGAKILARPAYDPVFKVYDLLMAFDMQHLSDWGVELLARFDKRVSSGQSVADAANDE